MTKTKTTQALNVNSDYNPPHIYAWMASVVMLSLIIVSQTLRIEGNPFLRWTGVVLLLTAGIFIFTPFYLLSKYGGVQPGKSYIQTNIVVNRGFYSITRHPQYLGYIFLGCGFAFLSQHWVVAILAMAGSICFFLQAFYEEKYCLAIFGESYEAYLQQVPRFNIILGLLHHLKAKKS